MNYSTLIRAEDLFEILESPHLVIIDCRFSLQDKEKAYQDYLDNHIPGAHYAHLDRDLSGPIIPGQTGRHPLPKPEKLVDLFSSWGIDNEQQVVVYDQKSGAIAARLWWMLKWLGHESVAVLEGGWSNWTNQSFITDALPPTTPRRNFIPNEQTLYTVDASFVNQIKKDPSFDLVDSRAAFRYEGIEEPIDPIAGHIPGAKNLPFMENVDENGFFLSIEKLKERFSHLSNEETSIFYCGSGVTACHNILAFNHAQLGMPKLYPGSWSEWIIDPNRSIE